MFMGTRAIKRLLLLFVGVGLVIIAVLYGGKFFSGPVATTTPDPRDSLDPVNVISLNLLHVAGRDYDILARVQNPNSTYGSGDVQYTLKLFYNITGGTESFQEQNGSFYILPGQTKYIVITPVASQNILTRAEMHISGVDWRELDVLALEGVSFVITNSSYSENPQDGVFGRLRGFVSNNSDFDVNRADVAVILFDSSNNPIAVNRTELYTFLAHTNRGFETSW